MKINVWQTSLKQQHTHSKYKQLIYLSDYENLPVIRKRIYDKFCDNNKKTC